MPTPPSPYDVPNDPYHPWIQGYDYHDPLENEDDALDHERLDGVRLEKEQLHAIEHVNNRFARMGFPPINRNDTSSFMDKPPLTAYYAAEAERQVMSEKEQHAANMYLVECHKRNQFYGYYRYCQLISEIMVLLYRDIQDHVDTNGIVTTSESVRILEVLDSVVCAEIESSPNYSVDPTSSMFLDAYYYRYPTM